MLDEFSPDEFPADEHRDRKPHERLLVHIEPAQARPAAIRSRLSAVIGQDTAKDYLSVLFSLHLARVLAGQDQERGLPSAVLVGPTGVGKTHSMRSLSHQIGLPFVTVDCSTLVEAGIVGGQPEDIMEMLVGEAQTLLDSTQSRPSQDDVRWLAGRGIVFFDEFDKLASPDGKEGGRGGSERGRAVQRRLLTLLEGDLVAIGRKTVSWSEHYIHTANLLILVGGAFAGIDSNEVRSKRRVAPKPAETEGANAGGVTAEDIQNYGFMPELVARLPVIVPFTELSTGHLEQILRNDQVSPLKLWQDALAGLDIPFEVEDRVLPFLAKEAVRLRMGARALQQVVFPLLARKTVAADIKGGAAVRLAVEDFRRESQLNPLEPLPEVQTEAQPDQPKES
ncbi:ATP-dependent Clp protease ATP-binding subunit ClpX [Micromonospora fulviviridis]|uniref:AAA family ATPase n=1 Tax=Micromonospora fulviviridis TaxID=47860 RepID=UPI00166E78BD|nr:AAA family ATPase [Micromonospora fulviviridis]GGR72432.1 ATP-dependent Clp protease ATP-binding subunit ClpX [Micromonospora fulviviridis]